MTTLISAVAPDGSEKALKCDADGTLQVVGIVGGGGGTEYTEGDTAATIAGVPILWEDTGDTLRSVSAAKPMPVNPVGGATDNNQIVIITYLDDVVGMIGPVNETAPASDMAPAGLNGRLQRIAQGITSLIEKIPSTLGQTTMSGSMSVAVASNQSAIQTKGNLRMVEFTPTLDTSAYANGDVLFATTAITSVFDANGGSAVLNSVIINDKDDQGVALDLIFLRANTSMGTINVATSIMDAGADDIIGRVSISASDWTDLGGCRVADVSGLGKVLKTGAATTSLWVAAITRGTPTHTASGMVIKLGFLDVT